MGKPADATEVVKPDAERGRLFCCREGMVEGTTQELYDENRSLLKKRLFFLARSLDK